MEPRKLPLPKKKKRAVRGKKAKGYIRFFGVLAIFIFICTQLGGSAHADTVGISIDTAGDGSDMGSLKLLFTFALIALAPSLLIMMSSFTRIIIVFSFLRNALGLQQTPPNQVLVGLALFLSYFIMHPVIATMNETALKPYSEGIITQEEAIQGAQVPLKKFMLKQTKLSDLNLFLSLSEQSETIEEINPDNLLELGLETIVPSFITSELKRAFTIGFLLFLPFLVIDMIVASTLMSMGMVMLPPSMISLPFKLMLFVVVDGWSLIMEMLIRSFY